MKISPFKEGDAVLILGGGPIGIAVILALQAKGASKIIVSEPSKRRQEYAKKFGAHYVIDPTKEDVVKRCRELCDQQGVHVAYDCAGVQVGLDQAVHATRARGTIVNIASQLARVAPPGRSAYSTSKAALIQFTKCLAVDHAGDGIRANTLSPGAVDTLRTVRRYGSREEANRVRGANHLLGRTARAEEIAAGALFLASEQSSFMTGADLLIDGGYLAFKGSRPPATASTSIERR